MPKRSAALLVYRLSPDKVLELLIVHPGGPFWAKKDDAAWSIPKGEYGDGDDALTCALREFEEELGQPPPRGPYTDLGEMKQPSGKRIHCWSVPGDLSLKHVKSNTFEMEWPRGSGKMQTYPEIDRAEWFIAATAKRKLLKGHVEFVERLARWLAVNGVEATQGTDASEGPPALF